MIWDAPSFILGIGAGLVIAKLVISTFRDPPAFP